MPSSKTLHIVRHGKALQYYQAIADIDRPLVEKGITNNMLVASKLKDRYTVPDMILSSPAARALHTAHIFARVWGYPSARVQVNDILYMQGEDAVLDILYALPDNISSVVLVGHNPDFSYLADRFSHTHDSLPTSGTISVVFATEQWNMIHNASKTYETTLK